MKINKVEGIALLELYNLPTVQKITQDELLSNSDKVAVGISVRLSPKTLQGRNVYYPSIHNCKDIKVIEEFIARYSKNYNILIHKTVKPELIGSVSRLNSFKESSLVMETYRNFEERKREIIYNRMSMPVFGNKYMVMDLKLMRKDPEDYKTFVEVFQYLRKLPFHSYDLEYVIESGNVIFTDLTVQESLYTQYDTEIKDAKETR